MQGSNFLIVDPNYKARNSLARVLMQKGYVIQVDNVAEFGHRDIDSDFVFIPDRDGELELISGQLQDAGIFFPVIGYCGSPSMARVVQNLRGSCAGYIEWPGEESEIWATLDVLQKTSANIVKRRVAQARARHKLAMLTPRERQVAEGIGRGLSSKELAQPLGISYRTVEDHRANIMMKMGTPNMASLIRAVVEAGDVNELSVEEPAFSFNGSRAAA